MIVRRLLGLEAALSMGICGPEHDWRSWTFDLDPGEVDPVLGIHFLREAYEKAVPGYDRGRSVPALVESSSGAVVTADFRQITLDLEDEWTAYHRPGAPDLYPEKLREQIEEITAAAHPTNHRRGGAAFDATPETAQKARAVWACWHSCRPGPFANFPLP